MNAFLVAIGLCSLFVLGSVFALQPTPRQRQLARLRHCALLAGLRVQLRKDEDTVDYVLPWRAADLERARASDLVATRDARGAWTLDLRSGPPEDRVRPALERLPPAVVRVVAGAEGIVARWPERGAESEVARIAEVLFRLREACVAVADPAAD